MKTQRKERLWSFTKVQSRKQMFSHLGPLSLSQSHCDPVAWQHVGGWVCVYVSSRLLPGTPPTLLGLPPKVMLLCAVCAAAWRYGQVWGSSPHCWPQPSLAPVTAIPAPFPPLSTACALFCSSVFSTLSITHLSTVAAPERWSKGGQRGGGGVGDRPGHAGLCDYPCQHEPFLK